ncbi:hypothetical protein AAC387_Pa12g1695 [Persea americana]
MAFTHKILLCYSILLLAVLARSSKSVHASMPGFDDTYQSIAAPDLDHIDAHEPAPPRHVNHEWTTSPPKLYTDAHEPRPSNDDYHQLTSPPAKYHIDNGSPPSKLNIDTPVSPPSHNDTDDSTALPDHDVTGAESTDETCYDPCSQIPKRCSIFCMDEGYTGGICMPKTIIKPNPLCCCF